MYESEKLCLKWNDFQVNVNSAFGMLRTDQDFCNVTLVSEDGKHLEAHKVILASSSPFFLELLKRGKHPHPLIYMRGVRADELSSLIDFLYYGEANVLQESLDTFLALAEELKLKSLTGTSEDDSSIGTKVDTPTNNHSYRSATKLSSSRTFLSKLKPSKPKLRLRAMSLQKRSSQSQTK